MKKLHNFNDLYEWTVDNEKNWDARKDDLLRVIRELVYTLEDHNVSGVNLEQAMDYINEILGLEEE